MYHKIFQWNVLTQAYCNRNSYSEEHYTEDALDENLRRSKIMKQLVSVMTTKEMIVLHEVDYKLRALLSVEVDRRDYGMISQGHGNHRNWYMGSVILWPRLVYRLALSEYLTVSDLIKKNVKDPTPKQGWVDWALSPMIRSYQWISGSKSPPNYYKKATTRSNVLLHVLLEDVETGENVNVWGYHMPCAFREPQVMEYHANELVASVLEAKQGLHLLCMDGNFQPDNDLYERFYNFGMKSAAFCANDEEPKFTVKTNSTFGGEFEGTLDYVWFMDTKENSDNYSCEVEFPIVESLDNGEVPFLPTENIPSDHVWMNVTITTLE